MRVTGGQFWRGLMLLISLWTMIGLGRQPAVAQDDDNLQGAVAIGETVTGELAGDTPISHVWELQADEGAVVSVRVDVPEFLSGFMTMYVENGRQAGTGTNTRWDKAIYRSNATLRVFTLTGPAPYL